MMKKFVAVVTAAAMMTLAMGAFVGCASDEDVIREALTEELDGIKNQDETYMNEMAADMNADDFGIYGIDALDFMSKYLSGFDYTIDSVTVEGESAKAVVTLTCKSFSAYEDAIEAETLATIANTDVASLSDEEVNKLVGTIMMNALDKVEVAQTDPITIEYNLVDDTWEPTSASSNAIGNAMLSN